MQNKNEMTKFVEMLGHMIIHIDHLHKQIIPACQSEN